MKTLTKLFLLSFLILNTALAQTVQVQEVTGPDLSPGEKFSIRELIEAEVSKHDGFHPVKEAGKITLAPSALKLGNTAFLKIKVSGEQFKTRSVKMKTQDFEDIDRVVSRLVAAALNEEETEQSANLENITQSETNKYNVRYKATRQWIFGFGPTILSNSGTDESGYYFNFGYNWQLDPQWAMQLTYDFANIKESDADFSLLSLGVNYYFTGSSASPYFGLDFGYGSADANNCERELFGTCLGADSVSGWGASAKLGYQFFRTSTVNLGIEAKYSTLFDKHSEGTPGRFTLSLSAYY